MKPYRIVVLACFILCVAGILWIESTPTRPPSSPTASAFLVNYDPQSVIDRFKCDGSMGKAQAGPSSGPNYKSETGWYFAMRSDRELLLMAALHDDAVGQLKLNGARIVDEKGDVQHGFDLDYTVGKSVGSVHISPIFPFKMIHRHIAPPAGIADVQAMVRVRENWFPDEQAAILASGKTVMP
jgi:hypothetical protein